MAEDGIALGDFQKLIDWIMAPIGRAPGRIADDDTHQPVHVLIGKWVQDDGVHNAVHGCAAANPECQRTDGDGCKRAATGKVTGPKTGVANKMREPVSNPHDDSVPI